MRLLLVLLLSNAARAQTNDLSGQSSNSIGNVLKLVASHQLRPIADGAYPLCYTIKVARAVAKPLGLEWDYPWGLDLYGLLRAAKTTGDTNIEKFALDCNLIVARYGSWLVGLQSTCTNSAGPHQNLTGFYNSAALRDFFTSYGPGKFDAGWFDDFSNSGRRAASGARAGTGTSSDRRAHVGLHHSWPEALARRHFLAARLGQHDLGG